MTRCHNMSVGTVIFGSVHATQRPAFWLSGHQSLLLGHQTADRSQVMVPGSPGLCSVSSNCCRVNRSVFCFVKLLSGHQVCLMDGQTSVRSPVLSSVWSNCCRVMSSVFWVVRLLAIRSPALAPVPSDLWKWVAVMGVGHQP